MNEAKKQITDFLNKCEELKNCKFIMATTKIKDLLKCIVNSPQLYKLFESVTQDFDYLSTKQACFKRLDDGYQNLSYLALPQTVGDRLAFIFCLMVEFDKGTINFNDFLRQYFPEDGSYFSSYHAFCDDVILSLQQLISHVFAEILSVPDEEKAELPQRAVSSSGGITSTIVSRINLLIAREKQYITSGALSSEEKESGLKILSDLEAAVKSSDERLIDAYITAYNYYVLYNECVSDSIEQLIEVLGDLEIAL